MELSKEICIDVSGKSACFTDPSFRAENFSYEFITPSAARSLFKCIYWKPAIEYQITRIEIMNPIKYDSYKYNGLKNILKEETVTGMDNIMQKNITYLTDVCYRLYARMIYYSPSERPEGSMKHESSEDENQSKHYNIFIRRASKNQFFKTPYFGKSEFLATYRYIPNPENETKKPADIVYKKQKMFYDYIYEADYKKRINKAVGRMLFDVEVNHGVIIVPPVLSEDVIKCRFKK